MSNRVIKVSIVLIFMLFSTCLFNFCFAFTITSSEECIVNFSNSQYSLNIGKLSDLPSITSTNITGSSDYSSSELYDMCNNNGYYIYLNSSGQARLIVAVEKAVAIGPDKSYVTYLSFIDNITDVNTSNNIDCFRFNYNVSTGNWEYVGVQSGVSITPIITIVDSNISLYGYNEVNNTSSGYILISNFNKLSIDIKVVQTGSKTGHVEFSPVNWDGSMYYIKGSKSELEKLVSDGNISKSDINVSFYTGPISIKVDEYVLGLLFDQDDNVCFSKISDTISLDNNLMFDDTHRLRLDQDDLDTYYLFIHSPQERRLY